MVRAVLSILFGFFAAMAIYLFFHLGVYKSARIAIEDRPALQLLYRTHTGAYFQIGPTIDGVSDWARAHSVDCDLTFGEYLDNPSAVDQDRLRSRGGCILKEKPNLVFPSDMTFETRPAEKYVVAVFDGSPAIGPFKVYPKVKKFANEHGLRLAEANIEIYQVTGQDVTTTYLFRIENSSPK